MNRDALSSEEERAQRMLDATAQGDVQAIAATLCELDGQDDLAKEDQATARLAHEYTKEEGYDGLSAYARDILAEDAGTADDGPSMRRAAIDTALGGGMAWYWRGDVAALATGDPADPIGVAAGIGGIYIALDGIRKGYGAIAEEDPEPDMPGLDIGATDILDGPTEAVREELYRDHGVDTYEA